MSLVFAAVTPHPPVLMPEIGKEASTKAEKSKKAFKKLEEELYVSKPDIIIIITPHGEILEKAFLININPDFETNFEEFGHFTTKLNWDGAPNLGTLIKLNADKKNIPVSLMNEKKLDHGVSIPLYFLSEHLNTIKILPINYSELPPKNHLEFGKLLKDFIINSNLRFAVIASGDLSHGLTTESPSGFSQTGKEFDNKVIELLETRNTTGFLNLYDHYPNEVNECGYRSILILLGILKNMQYNFKNLAYESPLGVGYLTGQFDL